MRTNESSTSSIDTNMSRQDGGVHILAPRTYHRTTDNRSNEQLHAASNNQEKFVNDMISSQRPPPNWQPPRPPSHDYNNDYENPEDMEKRSELLINTSTNYNSYEMSLSQQRKSEQQNLHRTNMVSELKLIGSGGVLHKNSDGAYYIPFGSLQNASSSMSPASVNTNSSARYIVEKSNTPNPTFCDASVSLLKYPTNTNRSRRKVSIRSTEKRENKEYWRKCTIFLAIALLFSLLSLIFLLFKSPSYVYSEPSLNRDPSMHMDSLRALPPKVSIGEIVNVDLLPRHQATTELRVPRAMRSAFNFTLQAGSQIVLLMRAGVAPSLSLNDAIIPLRAERVRRDSRNHVKVDQFMVEGRHLLTFINERNRVEPISFVVTETRSQKMSSEKEGNPFLPMLRCDDNCNGRGECVMAKCKCIPGYTGEFCEKAICPVLCSGNGVFSGGVCICNDGYKGKECELRQHWCITTDCNRRGTCAPNGKCVCNNGWEGESCDKKSCPHPTCNNQGICLNGTCYCRDGWSGVDCSQFFETQKPTSNFFLPTIRSSTEDVKKCSGRGRLVKSRCECFQGFLGDECECESCLNGVCRNGKCECYRGWMGKKCDKTECAIGCKNCTDGVCQCENGWNGENCRINGCPNKCSNRGECVKSGAEWSCKCHIGRTGKDCSWDVETHCSDGLDNDNDGLIDCDDPQCCTSDYCKKHTACSVAPSPLEVLSRRSHETKMENVPFFRKIGFLISGKSVQSYTDSTQFDSSLVSVIRGRILFGPDESFVLPGVRVSDASYPLYGFTLSRNDGFFDLVVNGGREVTLKLMRAQFDTAKRTVHIPAGEIMDIGDVILHRGDSVKQDVPRIKCTSILKKTPRPKLFTDEHGTSKGPLAIDGRSAVQRINIGINRQLVYDSARVENASTTILIGLIDEPIEMLTQVHVFVNVAGRRFVKTLSPKVNLTYLFAWDKLNVYNQPVYGLANAVVRIGYEFDECNRDSEIYWIRLHTTLMGFGPRRSQYWTFDNHHKLDVINGVLDFGDGGYKTIGSNFLISNVIYGEPNRKRDLESQNKSHWLYRPSKLLAYTDGSIIIGDHNEIIRVINNVSTKLLKIDIADASHQYHLATNPIDGSVVISLPFRKQVWRIASLQPDDLYNNYEVIAGDGTGCSSNSDACGDGGDATSAQLIYPKGVDYDSKGNLYLADGRRLRTIDAMGTIRTISGLNHNKKCGNMFKLSEMMFDWPTSISIDRSNDAVYVLDSTVVYEIRQSIAEVKIGAATACDGEPLEKPIDIAASSKTSALYILEGEGRVRCLASQNFVHFMNGEELLGIAINSLGDVMVANGGEATIITLKRKPVTRSNGKYVVDNAEKDEKYVFNRFGIHLSTLDLSTGQSLYSFQYTNESQTGVLISISDSNGVTTKINQINDTSIQIQSSNVRNNIHMVSEQIESIDSIKFRYVDGFLIEVLSLHPIIYEYDKYGRVKSMSTNGKRTEIGVEEYADSRVRTPIKTNGVVVAAVSRSESELVYEDLLNNAKMSINILAADGYSIRSPFGEKVLITLGRTGLNNETMVMTRQRAQIPSMDASKRELTTQWDWKKSTRRNENLELVSILSTLTVNGVIMRSSDINIMNNSELIKDGEKPLFTIFNNGSVLNRIEAADNRMPSVQITHNSTFSIIEWGKRRSEIVLDKLGRIIKKYEAGVRLATTFEYRADSDKLPSKYRYHDHSWTINYDLNGRLKSVVCDGNSETVFISQIIHLNGDKILKRLSASNSNPYLVRLRESVVVEYITPDSTHHILKRFDDKGRLRQILIDGRDVSIDCWSQNGEAMCWKTNSFERNTTLQGRLISRQTSVIDGELTSFSFDYDDFMQLTTIRCVIHNTVLSPITFSYSKGRLIGVNLFQLEHKLLSETYTGHGMTISVVKDPVYRQIQEKSIIFDDIKASLKFERDVVTRVIGTQLKINNKYYNTLKEFDSNGRLTLLKVDNSKKIIKYDACGRIESINNDHVEWNHGGSPKKFGKFFYGTDANGWTVKRNNQTFEYDGYGRLVRARDSVNMIKLNYDEQYNRLQSIDYVEKNNKIYLYYANPKEKTQVTHYYDSKNRRINTLLYDDNGIVFAIERDDGTKWAVITDETNTVVVVVDGKRVVQLTRRYMFDDYLNSDKQWVPIGYKGGIDIPQFHLTIMKDSRPFDLLIGRYMSISMEAAITLNVFDIDGTFDMFGEATSLPSIPITKNEWLEMNGIHKHENRMEGSLIRSPITHSLTTVLERYMNANNEIIGGIDVEWSVEDIGFTSMLILSTEMNGKIKTDLLKSFLDDKEELILKKLFNGARIIPFFIWSPVPVVHMISNNRTNYELDVLSSATYKHFTLVPSTESIELRNGKTKIVIHYDTNKDKIMGKLQDEMKHREALNVWKSERKRIRSDSRNKWSITELRELESHGTVHGYDLEIKKEYYESMFSSIHAWNFYKT